MKNIGKSYCKQCLSGYNLCKRSDYEKHTMHQNLYLNVHVQLSFSSITQKTAYTCTSACTVFNTYYVLTIIEQTNQNGFFFFFLDEYAMQNVWSCNHRMFYFHCSGSNRQQLFKLLCHSEDSRVCSSVWWAQKVLQK